MRRKTCFLGQRTDLVLPPYRIVFQFFDNIIDPQFINIAAEVFVFVVVYNTGEIPCIGIEMTSQEGQRHITVIKECSCLKYFQAV
ncbi:hypothetical protein D9M68_943090 [compost metagenome]